MPKKPRNRVLLAAVLGLEIGLLGWGVYVFIQLMSSGMQRGLPSVGRLLTILVGMIVVYLLYLKKEKETVEEQVVGEKVRTGALLDALPAAALMLDGEGLVLAANSRAAALLGVDEISLVGSVLAEAAGGELGRRLAEGASGSFVAASSGGKKLRCTATLVGGAAGVRLAVLQEEPGATGSAAAPAAGGGAEKTLRECFEAVAPLLERTGDHLASLASAARASSPHEEGRAATLAGVAVRLSQAARRIRLADARATINEGRLRAALRPEELDFNVLIRLVAERLDALFRATGVELVVDARGGKLPVKADRTYLALALRDLLEVALAMTSPGGRVTLRAAEGADEIEVEVTDTGCGMGRQELDALFSAGGAPPVHEVYTGGIRDGLFVAKEVIEAAGGRLWAESAKGRGTRFSVRIPKA
jgi:signal transduction histidine kinase